MIRLEQIIGVVVELLRALFVDVLSEYVHQLPRRLRCRVGSRGMTAIHRHIQARCRTNLLNRISTEQNDNKAS